MITATVKQYIDRHQLLDKEAVHLVALSGGADSVALLLVMRELGYHCHAAHCNFHLRGEESDRDERFCLQLCESLGIALHRIHFDTQLYADTHQVSIEMAARDLRYRYFRQLMADLGAADICVAHHRDDQAETVVMNLMRGTGLQGLTGMAPRNNDVVRPLLCVSREQIEAYLKERGQDYVTDSTNLVADVTRNKIRLRVMPLLEEINPAAKRHIAQTAEYLAQARDFAQGMAEEALAKARTKAGGIDLERLLACKGHEYLAFHYLSRFGFNSAQVAKVLSSLDAQGKTWTSDDYECAIDRGTLLVAPKKEPVPPLRLPETGHYRVSASLRLSLRLEERLPDSKPSKDAHHATLDADKAQFPLTLRPTQAGDRFAPYGMKGSKLVSDYLTDRKRTPFQKRDQLVLTDATGHILWLVGERVAQPCAMTEETRRVLHVTLQDAPEE